MTPHKLQIKLHLDGEDTPALDPLIPVFHRWIRESAVEDLLIDVANYAHVHHGPGIMLIGHEADYGLDLAGGRPGLVYARKREGAASLADLFGLALRRVVRAARLLETDDALDGRFTFRADAFDLTLLDRLRAPNRPETAEAVRDALAPVVADLFGGRNVRLERVENDAREPITLRVRIEAPESLAALADRLLTEEAHVAG